MKNFLCLFLLLCFCGCSSNRTKLFIIGKWEVEQIGKPQKKDTAGVDPIIKTFSEQTARLSSLASAMLICEINGDSYEFHSNGMCDFSTAGVKTGAAPYKVSSDGKTLTLKGSGLAGKDQVYEVLSIDGEEMQLNFSDGQKFVLKRNAK